MDKEVKSIKLNQHSALKFYDLSAENLKSCPRELLRFEKISRQNGETYGIFHLEFDEKLKVQLKTEREQKYIINYILYQLLESKYKKDIRESVHVQPVPICLFKGQRKDGSTYYRYQVRLTKKFIFNSFFD